MIAVAYDHDGSTLVQIEIQAWDRVVWKQQGRVGALAGVVKGFSSARGRVYIHLPDLECGRWVKPRFLSVTRNGIRLP